MVDMAVSTSLEAPHARPERRFNARRDELVSCALHTLDELGYARTSLREIAHNSEYSHGVLHYYFSDKAELLTDCMQRYRAFAVGHFDELIHATGDTAREYCDRVAELLAKSLVNDAAMHRLWDDLRAQSMFEPSLQGFVAEIAAERQRAIGAIVARYAELAGVEPVSDELAADAFDGMFSRHVLAHRFGEPHIERDLIRAAKSLLPLLGR
jgi:AcrR family transcriptional regulator